MILVPIFPLQIVVYPFEELNLNIFEPRYRQLVTDCMEDDLPFGIPYFREGLPLQYGSLVKIREISKTHSDGKMDIKTIGIRPFELKRYRSTYPKKLYPGGYVKELYWEEDGDDDSRLKIRNLLKELYRFMNINKVPQALNKAFITFEIAHKVAFNKEQEYDFLKIISETERQKYMIAHLVRMMPIIREAEEMRKKIQLNGHFKHIIPPTI
ncbi:MAG: ATP-dependent Lon protease [Saprospiraceae bacterium]|jgi:ATP-dependent Lon protease